MHPDSRSLRVFLVVRHVNIRSIEADWDDCWYMEYVGIFPTTTYNLQGTRALINTQRPLVDQLRCTQTDTRHPWRDTHEGNVLSSQVHPKGWPLFRLVSSSQQDGATKR